MGNLEAHFPWKSVWQVKVPRMFTFFVWTVALDRILTVDNLWKRIMMIIDWCCMCKTSGQSLEHFLLHCMVARDIWLFVLVLFGVSWVMPKMVAQMLMECGPFVRLVDNTKQFGWNAIGRLLMDMNGQLIGSNNHCLRVF
jgi:hypothetical protein